MTKATNWEGDNRVARMDNDDNDNAAITVATNGRTMIYNATIINTTITPLDWEKQAGNIGGGTWVGGIVGERDKTVNMCCGACRKRGKMTNDDILWCRKAAATDSSRGSHGG